MAAQAGLCLAWSETPEDTFSHGVAHLYSEDVHLYPVHYVCTFYSIFFIHVIYLSMFLSSTWDVIRVSVVPGKVTLKIGDAENWLQMRKCCIFRCVGNLIGGWNAGNWNRAWVRYSRLFRHNFCTVRCFFHSDYLQDIARPVESERPINTVLVRPSVRQ